MCWFLPEDSTLRIVSLFLTDKYISDGTAVLATVDTYNLGTGLWRSTATGIGQLSVARGFLAVAALGSQVVFAGGMYASVSVTLFFTLTV